MNKKVVIINRKQFMNDLVIHRSNYFTYYLGSSGRNYVLGADRFSVDFTH